MIDTNELDQHTCRKWYNVPASFCDFPENWQALEEHWQKNHAGVPVFAHRDDFLQSSSPGSTGGAYKLCTIRALGCELIPAKGCEKRRVCLCCSQWLNICCCIELANLPLNKAHNVRHITVLGFVLVQHTKGHDDRRLAQLFRIAAVKLVPWLSDEKGARTENVHTAFAQQERQNLLECSSARLWLAQTTRPQAFQKVGRRISDPAEENEVSTDSKECVKSYFVAVGCTVLYACALPKPSLSTIWQRGHYL